MDALAYLDGPAADLAFRRGWTHGVPALIVLPLLLTGGMLLFDRAVRRLGRAVLPSAVVPREVLLLSAVSILSHPILDTLNTYGVRWLMPFRGDWYYGDTLFIVDPWLWLVLGAGVMLSRPRGRGRGRARGHLDAGHRPARVALAVGTAYIAGMLLLGLAARRVAQGELNALGGPPVERIMVAPRPLTPLVRQVVAVQGDGYEIGTFHWLRRPHIERASLRRVPRPRPDDPALAAAATTPLGRRFLGWARFPTVQVEPGPAGGSLVHLVDLRYADAAGTGFGTVTIALATPPTAFAPPPDTPESSPPAAPAARRR